MKHKHLFTFCTTVIVAWALGTGGLICFWPHLFFNAAWKGVVERGLGIKAGGIPVNTLYTLQAFASPLLSKSPWVLTGNRDTLYTGGALDLSVCPGTLGFE